MKKFTFILVALFSATFATAQITLEHSFTIEPDNDLKGKGQPFHPCSYINSPAKYVVVGAQELPCPYYMNITYKDYRIKDITFINPGDFNIYKTLDLSTYPETSLHAIAYDVFAIDKIALIIQDNSNRDFIILDEDGNVLKKIDNYYDRDGGYGILFIERMNDQWKLVVPTASYEKRRTLSSVDIYSLPGDGSEPSPSQAISNTSSPKRSARKIAREGQVLVETENNTYDLRGQEVK